MDRSVIEIWSSCSSSEAEESDIEGAKKPRLAKSLGDHAGSSESDVVFLGMTEPDRGADPWPRVLQRQDSSSDNLLHEEGILCKRIKTFDPKMSPVKMKPSPDVRYYENKPSTDVKKFVVFLEDDDGDTMNLALLQYLFTKGEHDVKPAPRGNAKGGESYVRTMPSTLMKLKTAAIDKTAKRALSFVSNDEGGIEHAVSAGVLPHGCQQVHDIRRKFGSPSDLDPIFFLMLMCKESEGKKGCQAFVRLVNGAPFPMMVLTYDWTLDDLVRFCTPSTEFSIVGLDPTFSLGAFDVTVTTYRHLMLRHKTDPHGKPPVMIGPLFVHLRRDFAAYHFFASTLVSLRPSLKNLKCFGSDGEDALEQAFSTAFPNAVHVRCFLHFRGNVEQKLREMQIPASVSKEIVRDILGNPAQLEHGLVDAEDECELDAMVASLEPVWNEREEPYNTPPQFHKWFVKYCRNTLAQNMIRSVREKAKLGSPPEPYYTNEVESKNNVLKQQLNYKTSELPTFVENMKHLLSEQNREVERAVATTGEYRLSSEYSNLAVSTQKWFTLSEQQHAECISKFKNVSLHQGIPEDDVCGESMNPLSRVTLPDNIKKSLWDKAQSLAKDEASMVRSPGSTSDWIVKSAGSQQPHYVKAGSKGGYVCDSNCLAYKSMKICSHTVAVALRVGSVEELVRNYSKLKGTPNLTSVAEARKPSTVGKKQRRKASSKTATKHVRTILAQATEGDFTRRTPLSTADDSDSLRSYPERGVVRAQQSSQVPLGSPVTNTQQSGIAAFGNSEVHISQLGHSWQFVVNTPHHLIPLSNVYQSPLIAGPTTTLMASPGQKHALRSLPPLVAVQQPTVYMPAGEKPAVENPFTLVFIHGNISWCNGCKGRIKRGEDGKPLPAPGDLVLRHPEYVVYQNPKTGLFRRSCDKRNVYYHPQRACVAPNFLNVPEQHIHVDLATIDKLSREHKELLFSEFGLDL